MEAFKAAVREFLQPPSFFEALGVRYVGPIDGHDIAELEDALRNAIELSADGPIVVHVLTQKGRGYPPAEDDDEKHLHDAPVFDPGHRAAEGGADRLHAGVRRGDHQGGRARLAPRRHHRGDAGPDRPAPVPGPLPRPLLRRRHRRAARRHGRRRHGDGRPASRRRALLDVPQPGVGPGRLRRRAAPAAGDLLPRPGRHHRDPTGPATTACTTWRCSPRCPACACSPRRAARSCSRCCTTRSTLADDGPVAIRYPRARPARSPSTRSAPGCAPARCGGPAADRRERVRARRRQAGRRRREGRRALAGDGHRGHGVGRALLRAARRRDDRRRRRATAPSSPARTASATAASA